MRVFIKIWFLAILLFAGSLKAQEIKDSAQNDLKFDIFNPEDSLGNKLFSVLVEYERLGHFGSVESHAVEKKYVENYVKLFDSNAKIPEDMSDTNGVKPKISIADYAKMAYRYGYLPYILFIERREVSGVKLDSSEYYYATINLFKLFDERAIIGEKYKHAANFSVGLRFDKKGKDIKIVDVNLLEDGEHFDFILGNYGRHIYSPILVSNNFTSLVKAIPPPYVPTSKPTLSNFFIRAGIQYTDIFYPEAFQNNLDPNYSYSGTESGLSGGFFYQKAFPKKDLFGLLVGVEFEQNTYENKHENAYFVYDSDKNGEPLKDLEGGEYDLKHVYLNSYKESGTLNYLKPEIGLFFNLIRSGVNIQILGSVGNAFLMNADYSSTSNLSYEGEIIGQGNPIQEDALGFYKEKMVESTGEFTQVQSYMFYKGGIGIDFIIANRIGISFLGEYKGSMTYMIRKNSGEQAFLDPDGGAGFGSQLNMLSDSRNYSGFAVHAGIKIFLNEKR